MKVSLICTETWTEVIPESEITFVDCYGHKNGETLKIPASTLNYYKGQTFTAKNKADVKSALATGKWKINQ